MCMSEPTKRSRGEGRREGEGAAPLTVKYMRRGLKVHGDLAVCEVERAGVGEHRVAALVKERGPAFVAGDLLRSPGQFKLGGG